MSRLVRAIQLAAEAHAGQLDKTGQPFIGHPLRVMARGQTESEMVVGVLHDVVEDTPLSLGRLWVEARSWLTEDEFDAVCAITRRTAENEKYRDYVVRCGKNVLARQVKRYDILDNADPARGWTGVPFSRYRWAWGFLFPGEPIPKDLEAK